jgi:replicative DNA helicase
VSELVPKIAFADQLERALIGSALIAADPHVFLEKVQAAHADLAADMGNLRHVVLWRVLERLRESQLPITAATVEHQLAKQGNLEAVGGISFLGELALEGVHGDLAIAHVPEIQTAALNRRAVQLLASAHESARRWPHDAADLVEETRAELGRLEQRLPGRRTYDSGDALDRLLEEQARLPWVDLALGDDVVGSLPLGESAYLMGPSGSGKSTLAFAFAANHAKQHGPALIVSREMTAANCASRVGGMLADRSWSDVLRGGEAMDEARAKLREIPRLVFVDDERALLGNITRCIRELRRDFEGQPIMIVVDYVQIMESTNRHAGADARLRVSDVVDELRRMIQREKLLGLTLSQMSRASSRAARNGDLLGADSTDSGAESAAIERAAALTLTIGKTGDLQADGSRDVELSIGKGRYGGGDRVLQLKQWPASGLTRCFSETTGAKAREERTSRNAESKRLAAENAVLGAASKLTEAVSKVELKQRAGGAGAEAGKAIDRLIERGDLVAVGNGNRRKIALARFVDSHGGTAE